MLFNKLAKIQNSLFKPAQFGLRVRVRREPNYSYENELKSWKLKTKEYRVQHTEEYWNTQTQVENKHIEDFRVERMRKERDDMHRHRTSICTIAGATKDKLNFLQKKEDNLMETMRKKDISRSREKMDRKIMLDGLQIEAVRHWPTLANLHYKINSDVVLPQTILNFGEYQAKLQKLAMFSE